jgi:hypothetical protein
MIKGQPFVAYCDWVRLTVAYLLWGWSGLFDNNLDRAATLLNHCYWRSHCRLLPPIRSDWRFAPAVRWRAAISSDARRFASMRTMGVAREHSSRNWQAIFMITSSPALDSASLRHQRVGCRASVRRPLDCRASSPSRARRRSGVALLPQVVAHARNGGAQDGPQLPRSRPYLKSGPHHRRPRPRGPRRHTDRELAIGQSGSRSVLRVFLET